MGKVLELMFLFAIGFALTIAVITTWDWISDDPVVSSCLNQTAIDYCEENNCAVHFVYYGGNHAQVLDLDTREIKNIYFTEEEKEACQE